MKVEPKMHDNFFYYIMENAIFIPTKRTRSVHVSFKSCKAPAENLNIQEYVFKYWHLMCEKREKYVNIAHGLC